VGGGRDAECRKGERGNLFQDTAESSPPLLWAADRRLRIASSYRGGPGATDLRADRVTGMTVAEFFRVEDPDAPPIAAHRGALRGEVVSFELDWAGRTYQATVAPHRDADGRIIGCIGSVHGSVRHGEAEEAEAYASSIVGTVREPLVVLDVDFRVVSANRSFYRTFRVQRDQTEGRPLHELGNRQWDIPALRDLLDGVLRTGEPFDDFEVRHRFPGIGHRTLLLNARSMVNRSGRPRLILLAMEDVTERRRLRLEREALISELEAKNAELERFTYTVSHDLRSPLITIQGFLGQLIQNAAAANSEQKQADMVRIRNAARRMQQLLDGLLDLSRIGRVVNPPEEVSLGRLAARAVEALAGAIAERGVEMEISDDLPVVFGDRLRLSQVMQNLIDNAVKFMGDQPRPRIEIGTRQDGGETVTYVRDNGIGINLRYDERLFGLFDQLDPHSAGTGIGLTLVKRIVEVHGGRIWVESEGPGRGSTFCSTIPRKRESADHDR